MATMPPSNADRPSFIQNRTVHDAILDALGTKDGKEKLEKLTKALVLWQETSQPGSAIPCLPLQGYL
jgi:hypothetical protein